MNYLLLLIITSIIALIPIIFIKKYINTKNINNLIVAGFFYLLLLLSYVKVFSQSEVTSAYTLLQIIQVLIIVFIGFIIYKETVSRDKIIGIGAGLICIYFLTK
jgi:multidrug transporter EmrE-like cation transporter